MLENTDNPSVREVSLSNHISRMTNLDLMDSIKEVHTPQRSVVVSRAVAGTSMQVQIDAQHALLSRWEDIRMKFPDKQLWDLPSWQKTGGMLEAPVPDYIPC
jgi:hypothetical protein